MAQRGCDPEIEDHPSRNSVLYIYMDYGPVNPTKHFPPKLALGLVFITAAEANQARLS